MAQSPRTGLPPGAIALTAMRRPVRAELMACALVLVFTALSSAFVVAGGVWIRFIFAIAVASLLVIVALSSPGRGTIVTFGYLVFLAFLRRVFLPTAPWVSADPMLLVGPVVAVVLLIKAFILDRRRLAPDLTSRLVVAVLLITFIEVVNPDGGGVGAGIAGLMFMAVPLLWFFVGREFLGPYLDRLMALIVVMGCVVGAYGLWQTEVGDPPWDVAWTKTPGASAYNSLFLGTSARPFGTFSSFTEYALFIGTALVVSVSFVMRGRLIGLLPLPLLAAALFLASGRGPLVTALFGVVVMVGMKTGRPRSALLVTVVAIAAVVAALHFGASSLSGSAGSNALVSHEIGGLANPLDPNNSTLLVHLTEVVYGFKSSLSHPLGQGTAVTNGAAGLAQTSATIQSGAPSVDGSKTTEVDISNAFVALGIPGGLLYAVLVLLVIGVAIRAYFRGRHELLPIIGILFTGLGEWENGGFYALAPLIWMLAGVVVAASLETAGRPPLAALAAAGAEATAA